MASDGEESKNQHATRSIEVDPDVYVRFEKARSDTAAEGVPEMEPGAFLGSLLDTREAVQEGYYDGT